MIDLAPLRALETAIANADRDELPEILGQLARVEVLARLRLAENGVAPLEPEPDMQPEERLLKAKAAAEMLDVRVRWLYDHADTFPFTRRLGPRTLRFSVPGIRRWLETRR